ncbi:MAG: sulfurtransferase complex subunit TusB [Buchnera aphidicola (Chaetogeoica yunlongensis)]
MLHILMRSPFETDMVLFINMLESLDDVLMLQNSVIMALEDNIFLKQLLSLSVFLYVLEDDLCARGLLKKISSCVQVIDYKKFVNLTEQHEKQILW